MSPSCDETRSNTEQKLGDGGDPLPTRTDRLASEVQIEPIQALKQHQLDNPGHAIVDINSQQGKETSKYGTSDHQPWTSITFETSLSEGQMNDSAINTSNLKRLPTLQALGLFGCVVIVGGTALILPPVVFLLYLWSGKSSGRNGQGTPNLWRTISLDDWATRAVALCSLLLRIITAAQAAICTSLVAALLIERRQVPLSKIARLSLARDVNGGPIELFRTVLSCRSSFKSISLETVLLLAVALASVTIQFSSTILLSDLGTATITQYPITTHHNVALSPKTIQTMGNWHFDEGFARSNAYSIFGEYETTEMAASNNNGVSDTKIKQRAFLPFNETDRETLRSFKGPTVVMTSRVSCVRPSINATISVASLALRSPDLIISGRIFYEETFKNTNLGEIPRCVYDKSRNSSLCLPTTFNCTVFVGGSESSAETMSDWAVSACYSPVSNLENNHNSSTLGSWNRDSAAWDPRSSWHWLIMATNAKVRHREQLVESGKEMVLGMPTTYEHWNSYGLVDNTVINVTLCTTALNMSLANVELSSNIENKEPELKLDSTTNHIDVGELQNSLDATTIHRSAEDRGLLSMTKVDYLESAQSSIEPGLFAINGTSVDSIELGSLLYQNSLAFANYTRQVVLDLGDENPIISLWVCVLCSGYGYMISDEETVLFSRIINTSGRAAVALETLLMQMGISWYYRIFPILDVSSNIEISFSAQHIVPLYWNGLIIVTSTVAVHIVGVWIITALYLIKIRYTRQGNIWHTISQLMSEQTIPILESSNELRDKDVAKLLKGKDHMVKLGRSETGRVTVM